MNFLFVLSQEDMNTENKAAVTLDRIEPMNVKRIKKISGGKKVSPPKLRKYMHPTWNGRNVLVTNK